MAHGVHVSEQVARERWFVSKFIEKYREATQTRWVKTKWPQRRSCTHKQKEQRNRKDERRLHPVTLLNASELHAQGLLNAPVSAEWVQR